MQQSQAIADGVWLTRTPQGIELYFPPFREPAAALSLGLFGVTCLIPGVFAAIAIAPLAISNAAGMVAIWLMSIFVLPFIAFGLLFLTLAGYCLANSLTVVVTGSDVRTLRRVLGFPVREQRVSQSDMAALEPVAAARYRRLKSDVGLYDLVVKTKVGAGRRAPANETSRLRERSVTVAESLRGEESMERVRAEISALVRLERAT